MGFARAPALRLGRKPFQPLVKGGARALQATLVKLLGEGQYGRRNPQKLSHLRPSGFLRKSKCLVGQAQSTSPTKSPTWQPWRSGLRGQQPSDEASPAGEGPLDVSLARINPIKGARFRAYRSRLLRLAQKVPKPPTTPFAKLWKPLFLMLRVLCDDMKAWGL